MLYQAYTYSRLCLHSVAGVALHQLGAIIQCVPIGLLRIYKDFFLECSLHWLYKDIEAFFPMIVINQNDHMIENMSPNQSYEHTN